MPLSKQRNGEEGFFLTDATIALFVIAAVAGSLVTAFDVARRLAAQADARSKALVIATACIERGDLSAETRAFKIDGVDYAQERSTANADSQTPSVVRLVRLRCRISWARRGGPQNLELNRIETAQ